VKKNVPNFSKWDFFLYNYNYKRIILNKMFKKRKDNQNKPTGRKRKKFATIALSLSLLFAKPRLSFSQSSSPNFGNQEVHERVIDDREFNLLKDNDQQVIFVKGEGNPITPPTNRGPSSFPTPPSGGRPSRPATGINPYIYRTLPKVVDQGLGGAPNPAGAGGGENFEFDDSSPASQKLDEINSEHRSFYSEKKKSAEQCELNENTPREINEKFESKSVKKLVKKALENQKVKQEYEGIKKRINEGVDPIDIGKKSTNLHGNKVLIKGAHGRYVVEIFGDQVNVLGMGARGNSKNMQTFQNLMNEMYGLNLQY
jgi:hypothetical protein